MKSPGHPGKLISFAPQGESLLPCPACDSQVSPDAHACPHCGHPLKRRPSGVGAALRAIGGVVAVLGFPLCVASPEAGIMITGPGLLLYLVGRSLG